MDPTFAIDADSRSEGCPGAEAATRRVGIDDARELGRKVRVGQPAATRDGRVIRVSRLLRDRHSRQLTHFVVRTRRFFGRELIVSLGYVTEVSGDRITLSVNADALDKLPVYRTDEEIDGDVERALARDEDLRRSKRALISVAVRDGFVTLRGYVPDRRAQRLAAQVSGCIRGVQGLRNRLVADDDLEARVARAMAGDARTREYVFQVEAQRGIVRLTGALECTEPSADTQAAAQEIAASVEGVRSAVVDFRGAMAVEPLPILPGVGLPVYATDGPLGQLELVAMNPRSRRVTDLVVVGHFPSDRRNGDVGGSALEMRCLLVPAKLVGLVTDNAILLEVDRAGANRLSEYREDDYRVPERGWQSSFDYRREDLRFPIAGGGVGGSRARSRPISRRGAWIGAPRG